MIEPAADPEAELETVVVLPVAKHALKVDHTVVQVEVALPEIDVGAHEAVQLEAADALHEDDEDDEVPEVEDAESDDSAEVEDADFELGDCVGSSFESGKSPSGGKMSGTTQGGSTPPGGEGLISERTGNTR